MSDKGSTFGRFVVGALIGCLVTMPLWISTNVPSELRSSAIILGPLIGAIVYCNERPKLTTNITPLSDSVKQAAVST